MTKFNRAKCVQLLRPFVFWNHSMASRYSSHNGMDSEFTDFLRDLASTNVDSTTVIINVDELVKKIERWSSKMDKIDPYYFVHCNPHPLIIKIMHLYDIPFSCTSVSEIERVLSVTSKSKSDKPRVPMIVSTPHKTQDLLKTVFKYNIEFLVADSEFELAKIKSMAPKSAVLIRIQVPRKRTEKTYLDRLMMTRDAKYGVFSKSQIEKLFLVAREISMEIVGVTFNVGTDCQDPEAFELALEEAIRVFEVGDAKEFDMFLLNIGGGFPSKFVNNNESEYLGRVYKAIEKCQKREKIKVIAEPGRYLVESSVWLMARVIGKRVIETIDGEQWCHYHVNESKSGLLSVYNNRSTLPLPYPFYEKQTPRNQRKSVVWGKSGSPDDLIMSNIELPELVIGEYLAFQQCGAYLTQTELIGLPCDRDAQPTYKYFASKKIRETLKQKGLNLNEFIEKIRL